MDKNTNEKLTPLQLAEQGRYKELEEDGKFVVKEWTISGHKLVVRADFQLLKDAFIKLMNTEFEADQKNNGKKNLKVSMDMIGAGDKILFFGGLLNKDKFINNTILRLKACQELGAWVAEIMGDDVEEEEKKILEES